MASRSKRYLRNLLQRSKAKRSHQTLPRLMGGVEHIYPSQISGWVYSPSTQFSHVELTDKSTVLASTKIVESRPDVASHFSISPDVGFVIELSNDLNLPFFGDHQFNLHAVEATTGARQQLNLITSGDPVNSSLQQLFQSDFLGILGHVDGLLSDGFIHGWAGYRSSSKPATIWIHHPTNPPIPIECNLYRGGLSEVGLRSTCGFRIDPSNLPSSLMGSSVSFSFDRFGLFPLSGLSKINIPGDSSLTSLSVQYDYVKSQVLSTSSYSGPLLASTLNDLTIHLKAIKELDDLLDTIDKQ